MALNTGVVAGTLAGPFLYNDFLNLLTGVMTDQSVKIKYTPGSGTTPALTLQSDSGRPLLKGLTPAGAQAFLMDENGNLTVASIQTSGGGLLTVTGLQTTQSGAANGLQFKTWNGAAGVVPFSIGGQFGSAPAYIDSNGELFIGRASNSDYIQFQPSSGTVARWTITLDASANMLLDNHTAGTGLTLLASGGLKLLAATGSFIQSGTTFFGIKDSGGTKLGEFKANGQLVVTGSNPCFLTTAATVGFASGGSFDSFDIAEAFPTDNDYPHGTVLCPGPDHKLTRCTHDGCRAALIVSKQGAVAIGMGTFTEDDTPLDPTIKPMALVGRVLVRTEDAIEAFDTDDMPTLVTSDGCGGVRAMRSGESGYVLGYALHDAHNGEIGIVVRPMYVQG